MTRVEWTRLAGEDVEAVVAMFVNRERPKSVRITPSRGDGGVDILDRDVADGGDEVFQVKRYTGPLGARERKEVEKSLERLMTDERWAGLSVSCWYLVTPWDPTPEAETWLQDAAATRGLVGRWLGLTFVEALATKYPEVVDYYLHGGRGEVEKAYAEVRDLFGLNSALKEDLPVLEVTDRVQAALAVLDHDPHYRYELHFGKGDLPPFPSRPGLVMTTISGSPDGRWVAVDLFARCAASISVRPIVVSGTFTAPRGSEFEKALRDFHDFGAPFVSPVGAYSGEVDAPGGLGGPIEKAQVSVLPVGGANLPDSEFYFEVLDSGGSVLEGVDVDTIERTAMFGGRRVLWREAAGVFSIEMRAREDGTGSYRIEMGDTTGLPVRRVLPAFKFLATLEGAAAVRISIRHSPPEHGVLDRGMVTGWPPDLLQQLRDNASVVELLTNLQAHTSTVIRMPNVEEMTAKHVEFWATALRVLDGGEMLRRYPEGQEIIVDLPDRVESGITIGMLQEMELQIGQQRVPFGQVEVWLDHPTIRHVVEIDGGRFRHFLTTPDRVLRYRRSTPGVGEESAPA